MKPKPVVTPEMRDLLIIKVPVLELLFEINGGCTVIVERSAVNDSTCRVVSADFTFDLNTISYNTSS
jgi:hypothetical protein